MLRARGVGVGMKIAGVAALVTGVLLLPCPAPAQSPGSDLSQPGSAGRGDGGIGGGNFLTQLGGSRGGPGGFPGGGNSLGGGRQGGSFPGGGVFGLAPNQTIRVAAFCTDLFSDAPDATTRFTGGRQATVTLADGTSQGLDAALRKGLVVLRGRDDSFDPVRRDGRLLLDLYLTNQSDEPVRVSIRPGTQVTPNGQAAQPLAAHTDHMFALAARRGLTYGNTMQYAVWAARGSTVEEVEQTNMVQVPRQEVARVQNLLDESGVDQQFDRDRNTFASRYEQAEAALGSEVTGFETNTVLPIGGKAVLSGVRNAEGKGVATVRVLQSRARFYYRAEVKPREDGKLEVKLFHLVTGRPIRANRGTFTVG